uniref:94K n=1 Tax=Antheraea proylei nucleopolyhedrovirus TaxID=2126611 RepID=A0A2Z6C596_NPVAP|nr:94K [Antheraea proylei nucleopolyhedrovirus]
MYKYYVYATDDSASTYNDREFNRAALLTLQQFQDEAANAGADAKVVYLHWSADCKEQNYERVKRRYEMRNGEGGDTRPSEFLKWVQKYVDLNQACLELLYMVTDGQIPQREIGRCQELLNKHPVYFKRVVFHAINWNESAIDLSVASVVCAESACEIYRNNQLCERVNLTAAFDYDNVTVDNFTERQYELLAFVRHKFINAAPTDKAVLVEADKLKRLRRRLMDDLRTPAAFDNITTKDAFVTAFKSTRFYQTLRDGDALGRERAVDAAISTAKADSRRRVYRALRQGPFSRVRVAPHPRHAVLHGTVQPAHGPTPSSRVARRRVVRCRDIDAIVRRRPPAFCQGAAAPVRRLCRRPADHFAVVRARRRERCARAPTRPLLELWPPRPCRLTSTRSCTITFRLTNYIFGVVQQFPSKEQFTEYVQLVKSEQNGRVAVFPQNIAQNIAAVHAAYAQKTVNMSVQQFLVLANKSVNRRERIKMEIQDSSDESADKLIADAEKRVGLKRV